MKAFIVWFQKIIGRIIAGVFFINKPENPEKEKSQ
jgi:hypothetical protein